MLKTWPWMSIALAAVPAAALADDVPQTPVVSTAQGNLALDVTASGTSQPDGMGMERGATINLHLPTGTTVISGSLAGNDPAQAGLRHRKVGVDSKLEGPAGISFDVTATDEAQDIRQQGALVPTGLSAASAMSETDAETGTATAHPLDDLSLTLGAGDTHTTTANNSAPLSGNIQSNSVIADSHDVFAKAAWSPFSFLKLDGEEKSESMGASTAGAARLDDEYHYQVPSASATLSLWSGADVKAAVEEAVSPINTADFAALSAAASSGAATQIAPDREWRNQLSFDQKLGDAKLSASITQARIQSTTELTLTDAGAVSPVSVAGGARQEANVDLSLPLDGLGLADTSVETQGAWQQSRIHDPLTGEYRAVSGETPHQGMLKIVHKDGAHHLQWGVKGSLATDQNIYQPAEVSQFHTGSGVGAFVQYKPGDYALALNVDGLAGGNRSEADTYYSYDRADGGVDRTDRIENTSPLVSFSLSRTL
jgi:hypothetical protein